MFIAGFLNLYTNDILAHSVVGDCSVHCRIFCSIPGHWLVALPPSWTTKWPLGNKSQSQLTTTGIWEYMGINAGRWLDVVVRACEYFLIVSMFSLK